MDRSRGAGGSYSYLVAMRRRRQISENSVEKTGLGPWLKRWTIPIVGAITPVGLIVVNISIFIAKHLEQFRWTIAILAFISSVMLNSWAGLNIYRLLQRRRPHHAIFQERNQEIVLVAGMALIIAAAFLTALFCYLGLASQKDLPNSVTFITGLVAIAVPMLLQVLFRRGVRTQRPERPATSSTYAPGRSVSSATPPTPPPVPPPVGDVARRV
jgi:chromate transport protein ChrA